MSFVTFVRDYIQDPDRIIHIPSFIFDACKEFFLYIFSFQWIRNLTYVTLYKPNGEQSSTLLTSSLYDLGSRMHTNEALISSGLIQNNQSTNQIQNLLNDGSWLSTYFELPPNQLSFFHNSLYGFFNGFSSTFHFCAVTILVVHVLLNETKNRAFKIALTSCFGDISCMVAVFFGFREVIVPWLALEPLGYILGFGIQLFFALEIIKDNRRIKANFDKVRQFTDTRRSSYTLKNETTAGTIKGQEVKSYPGSIENTGRLSFNRWVMPALVLLSWCEKTQFFQTGNIFTLQPTATLLEIPGTTAFFQHNFITAGLALPSVELQISVYLLTFIGTRIIVTWFCLTIFEKLVNLPAIQAANLNLINKPQFTIKNIQRKLQSYNLLISSNRQNAITYIKRYFFKIYDDLISLIYSIKSWFVPKSLRNKNRGTERRQGTLSSSFRTTGLASPSAPRDESAGRTTSFVPRLPLVAKQNQIQHFLRDPLAIAAVTCSLAFLPAYSTNFLITKSIGFFPEENRIKHSLFSPWDMPATVLASDMDFISNHPNVAEYPFFLPFYDKGDYGGWLGVGEEDIRYGPFRLWQSRRIRAPWRRTTLQEPALTFANDKSLFINPLQRTPDLKSFDSTSGSKNNLGMAKLDLQSTANIKTGPFIKPSASGASFARAQITKRNGTSEAPTYSASQQIDSLNLKETPSREGSLATFNQHKDPRVAKNESRLQHSSTPEGKKWKYLWKQFKTQNAYTRLLAINYIKPSKTTLLTKDSSADARRLTDANLRSQELSSTIGKLDISSQNEFYRDLKEQNIIKAENSKITKAGRKKLVEVLKKPLRKIKTSSFLHKSKIAIPFEGTSEVNTTTRNEAHLGNQKIDLGVPLKNDFLGNLGSHGKKISSSVHENFFGEKHSTLAGKSSITSFVNQQVSTLGLAKHPEVVETKIKDNKQSRKRFKKFKKKLRLFRTRAYKKRNTKIKRLKHFHYIKNKNKKRRKSRRLIYKLRRQYPYIRNIKERKADVFGLYSPVNLSASGKEAFLNNQKQVHNSAYRKHSTLGNTLTKFLPITFGRRTAPKVANHDVSKSQETKRIEAMYGLLPSSLSPETRSVRFAEQGQKINFKENPFYSTEYPKKKDFINVKKDFNLVFRTQIGERLDFAQEEIRARIFTNPYVHFLLNNRVDNFASRSAEIASPALHYVKSKTTYDLASTTAVRSDGKEARLASTESKQFSTNQKQPISLSLVKPSEIKDKKLKENDLFKRRLIISKYADSVDFLKPSSRHSYIDRVYNHQFKGTLSTARRLFSLKVQYDRPLIHSLNYESAIEHEALWIKDPTTVRSINGENVARTQVKNSLVLSHDKSPRTVVGESRIPESSTNLRSTGGSGQDSIIKKETRPWTQVARLQTDLEDSSRDSKDQRFKTPKIDESLIQTNLLEKNCSAPLYASWDPNLRKLILTNRYLNYKTITNVAKLASQVQSNEENDFKLISYKDQKIKSNNLIQFTNWPLKEPYFKDNEFLVSQLYSNSQPIDSLLSQENEKARPAALPRRVSSFNTVLHSKNNVQPTNAQRSQQFLKLESNDKKTFLFKHSWNSPNTASGLVSLGRRAKLDVASPIENSYSSKRTSEARDTLASIAKDLRTANKATLKNQKIYSFTPSVDVPTSAEQRKTNRMEEREYPLWMVVKTLPPNQGGFLWPGD